MEKVPKILPEIISLRAPLWQEDEEVLWTQVRQHDHESLWEKVARSLEVCKFHKGWESEDS